MIEGDVRHMRASHAQIAIADPAIYLGQLYLAHEPICPFHRRPRGYYILDSCAGFGRERPVERKIHITPPSTNDKFPAKTNREVDEWLNEPTASISSITSLRRHHIAT